MNIVLLHGWGYTPKVWDGLRAELDGYTVTAPTLQPASADLAGWAAGIASEIPPEAVLVSWSLGALLALQLAATRPVSGLFLIGATPKFVASADWPHGLEVATVAAFRTGFANAPARTLRRFVAMQTLNDVQRNTLTPLLEAALADPATPGLDAGLQLLEAADLRALRLPTGLPLQLLHGRSDALMPVAAAEWLAARHASAQIELLEDAGHAPLFSQPALLAARIKGFADACL